MHGQTADNRGTLVNMSDIFEKSMASEFNVLGHLLGPVGAGGVILRSAMIYK